MDRDGNLVCFPCDEYSGIMEKSRYMMTDDIVYSDAKQIKEAMKPKGIRPLSKLMDIWYHRLMDPEPWNDNSGSSQPKTDEARELLERCLKVLNADPYLTRGPLALDIELYLNKRSVL